MAAILKNSPEIQGNLGNHEQRRESRAKSPMEVGLNRLQKGPARALGALIAGFLIFAGVLTASPASAADPDPSTFAYTIAGTLQQDDTPITGVTITASKDGEKYDTKSDEFGEWTIMVPTDGIW